VSCGTDESCRSRPAGAWYARPICPGRGAWSAASPLLAVIRIRTASLPLHRRSSDSKDAFTSLPPAPPTYFLLLSAGVGGGYRPGFSSVISCCYQAGRSVLALSRFLLLSERGCGARPGRFLLLSERGRGAQAGHFLLLSADGARRTRTPNASCCYQPTGASCPHPRASCCYQPRVRRTRAPPRFLLLSESRSDRRPGFRPAVIAPAMIVTDYPGRLTGKRSRSWCYLYGRSTGPGPGSRAGPVPRDQRAVPADRTPTSLEGHRPHRCRPRVSHRRVPSTPMPPPWCRGPGRPHEPGAGLDQPDP
jgi:hypothetical protein